MNVRTKTLGWEEVDVWEDTEMESLTFEKTTKNRDKVKWEYTKMEGKEGNGTELGTFQRANWKGQKRKLHCTGHGYEGNCVHLKVGLLTVEDSLFLFLSTGPSAHLGSSSLQVRKFG